MKRTIPVFTALALIILILAGYAGYRMLDKYTPSKEIADLSEYYNTSGDLPALLYNYELQDTTGLYANGQYYLPITWVNDHINKRFYWDSTEQLLVYALPDQIVYADALTAGSNGTPLLVVEDGGIYLSTGLVANYTDIRITTFGDGAVRRIYVTDWDSQTTARVKKTAPVREAGGIKSPIVAEAEKDSTVIVLEEMEKWSRVETEDGHIGYIRGSALRDFTQTETKGTISRPEYGWTSMDEKIVLGWHQVTTAAGNATLESVLSRTKGVNVIAPTWFSLTDNEGNFSSLASQDYVNQAHERGIRVWALLDNFSGDVQTETLLSSTTRRKKLIDGLIAEVEKYGIDGLNLDFESLKKQAGPHYIEFIRELSIPCRAKGIVLSVDNYVPSEYTAFYDRAEQAIAADYVIVMGYDEHYSGGEKGSVASLPFVDQGITGTLLSVPKERVINGVPFYTRLWTETSDGTQSKAIGIREAKSWVEENQVELTWLEDEGQYYGEYASESGMQYLWLEDEESLKLKMELIKKYDLAGVACWKLGMEDEAAWTAIDWE